MTMVGTPEQERLDFDAPLHDPSRDRPGGEHSLARDTERAAAKAAHSPRTTAQRLRVLEAIAEAPDALSDWECSQLLGINRSSAGKRRGELALDGWIRDSGKRRATDSGVKAICWELSPEGREAWGKR